MCVNVCIYMCIFIFISLEHKHEYEYECEYKHCNKGIYHSETSPYSHPYDHKAAVHVPKTLNAIEGRLAFERSKLMKNYTFKGYALIIVGILINVPSLWSLFSIKQSIVFKP
jgi:hypothetical protein